MSRLSRRGIMGGAAALVPAVGVGAVLPPAEPDAELIARCRAYIAAATAYDQGTFDPKDETSDPLWQRMDTARQALRGMRATTMAGLTAKAEVACFEARQIDGSLNFDTSFTDDWPEQVILDLLRMTGGRT